MRVELWTDGSGTSDEPIGWAYVLRAFSDDGALIAERNGGGFACDGTNNRAELTALLEGLRVFHRPATVTVYTDSEYLLKPFTDGYLAQWADNGWRKLSGGPVQNVDLWQAILEEARPHELTFEHVKGHAGLNLNERCDRLAGAARRMLKDELAEAVAVCA